MATVLYNKDSIMPIVCERENWKHCPEHKHLSETPSKPRNSSKIDAKLIKDSQEDLVDDPDDDIISVNEYAESVANPVSNDSKNHMNAEEHAYFVDQLGYDPDEYWKKHKKEILALREKNAESVDEQREEIAKHLNQQEKFDTELLQNYKKKNGSRYFKFYENFDFTDTRDYSSEALKTLGFTDEDYHEVARPNIDGKTPSQELQEMRASYIANEKIYIKAKQDYDNLKFPMFTSKEDKMRARWEHFMVAYDAHTKMRLYAELSNRAEQEGHKYKVKGSTSIPNEYGGSWESYGFIDGGVPKLEKLHEMKRLKEINESYYAWNNVENEDLYPKTGAGKIKREVEDSLAARGLIEPKRG